MRFSACKITIDAFIIQSRVFVECISFFGMTTRRKETRIILLHEMHLFTLNVYSPMFHGNLWHVSIIRWMLKSNHKKIDKFLEFFTKIPRQNVHLTVVLDTGSNGTVETQLVGSIYCSAPAHRGESKSNLMMAPRCEGSYRGFLCRNSLSFVLPATGSAMTFPVGVLLVWLYAQGMLLRH
ncbi:hypothetical protein OUZ56_001639 [Daphnia magna]|uniref:Uncharacterized protein n=1 Tax=Daphnia magna TaxID=35525 RepID=A0ABR0A3A0_9CRUS|nr:hypothetical protein OUZ56_001639 [Daphnia magna]